MKVEFDTAPAQWPWHFPGNGTTAYVTGGFGFIGSHLVKLLLKLGHRVVVIDAVTYAARPKAVRQIAHAAFTEENFGGYHEEVVDIRSAFGVSQVFQKYGAGCVYHLAAESHVCRSISSPEAFVDTNILGTFNVLQAFRQANWKDERFMHVSTDEVFGELALDEPAFSETSQVKPRSPYAASKAASDHLALSFFHTYGLPVVVTNCSNNFGPNQNEEKLIPQTILRIAEGRAVRLYGDGSQRRDWLWVGDHVRALAMLASLGTPGERYCIGGGNELTNLDTVLQVHRAFENHLRRVHPGEEDYSVELEVMHTDDRPTDDKRYAIDASKLKQLGWRPTTAFHERLEETVKHYVENRP